MFWLRNSIWITFSFLLQQKTASISGSGWTKYGPSYHYLWGVICLNFMPDGRQGSILQSLLYPTFLLNFGHSQGLNECWTSRFRTMCSTPPLIRLPKWLVFTFNLFKFKSFGFFFKNPNIDPYLKPIFIISLGSGSIPKPATTSETIQ